VISRCLRTFLAICLVAIGIVIAAWESSAIPHHMQGKCTYNYETGEKNCPRYHTAFYVPWQIGKFIDEHNGVVAAIATVFIAAFTWTLWQSSEKMWKVTARSVTVARRAANAAAVSAALAEKSVDAFTSTEQPRVFISRIEPTIKNCAGAKYQGTKVPHEIMLTGTIKNYGRTPALIKQASAQLRFSGDPTPMTLSPVPPQFLVLERDKEHSFQIPVGDVLNQDVAAALESGARKVWLHFSFVYRDVSGNSHETAGRWSHNLSLGFWDGDYETTT
jgi:hypothetical protein